MEINVELVARLRRGDERAFVTVVQTFQTPLLRLARTFVRSEAVAEEVVQETWLAVVRGIDRLSDDRKFKAWTFQILANRARTRAVRERRTVPASALGAGEESVVDPERFNDRGMWGDPPRAWEDRSVEKVLANRESVACLLAALEHLPDGQRAVLTLRELEGLSSEETCNILDISETNQRVLLHRARGRVRAALEQHYRQT